MEVARFNYYDILEIDPHCPQHEVTAAYEKAKSTYSSDNPAIYTIFSQREARELMLLVDEAYSVLGNKTLRSLYDEKVSQSLVKHQHVSYDSLLTESKIHLPKAEAPSYAKMEFEADPKFEKEMLECTDWDGAFIKKVREYRNYSLERLSEITKISAYYINAIEKMDCKNLPAPVFVRGYVSQLSKVLNLNEKQVCSSYMSLFKQKSGNT